MPLGTIVNEGDHIHVAKARFEDNAAQSYLFPYLFWTIAIAIVIETH